ncbi:MAG: glycosyltransferase family protein [Desulfobacteraceae bacterium]
MARIVYGVSGEGSGHSSRARVVLEHLTARGHEVKVVTYGRGLRHLGADFDLFETEGLHIESVNNKVAPLKTLLNNLQRLPDGHNKLQALRKSVFKTFQPHAVITDFEPMCAYLARHYDLPLITIDNQHRLRYMHYDYPADLKNDKQLTLHIIRAMVPKPDVSLVTTFYFGEVKNQRTFLYPPLLRSQVNAAVPHRGDHILVYLTSGFESFVDMLKDFPRERFIIYGQGREGRDGHMTYKAPSNEGFLNDLAGSKGVMATAGFTLITEALHLQKPYLALPMAGQFEQAINAVFLDKLGCGVNMNRVTSSGIGDFLYRLPEFQTALARLSPFDNAPLLQKVDALLADDAAEAMVFHRQRRQLSRRPE